MAFCICSPFPCDNEGVISVNVGGTSSAKIIPGTSTIAPGMITGTISINGYAIAGLEGASSSTDKWLGVRCTSAAQGNQTNYIRYDGCADKYRVIPSTINAATVVGDEMYGVSYNQFNECAEVKGLTANIQNGITIAQETVTKFGHSLSFGGLGFPRLHPYSIFGFSSCYLQNLAIKSSFPTPAQLSATFQFVIDC